MTFVDVHMKVPMEMAVYLEPSAQVAELERNALLLYPYILRQTISHGRAAEILGIRKHELIDIYDKLGFSYLDLTMDDLDAELEAYRKAKANDKEKFDYTKWQREWFHHMSSDAFNEAAVAYSKEHPFHQKD